MEQDLLVMIKGGDMSAFDELSAKYHPLIASEAEKAYKNSGDYAEKDDLEQEAMIALYSAACSYSENDSHVTFGLYAKICIHNRLVSYMRKHRNYARNTILQEEDSEANYVSGEAAPEAVLLANEDIKRIKKLLADGITEYEKRVFSLYLADYSYADISKIVGRDIKSVDNAVWRVKSKIKSAFM